MKVWKLKFAKPENDAEVELLKKLELEKARVTVKVGDKP